MDILEYQMKVIVNRIADQLERDYGVEIPSEIRRKILDEILTQQVDKIEYFVRKTGKKVINPYPEYVELRLMEELGIKEKEEEQPTLQEILRYLENYADLIEQEGYSLEELRKNLHKPYVISTILTLYEEFKQKKEIDPREVLKEVGLISAKTAEKLGLMGPKYGIERIGKKIVVVPILPYSFPKWLYDEVLEQTRKILAENIDGVEKIRKIRALLVSAKKRLRQGKGN